MEQSGEVEWCLPRVPRLARVTLPVSSAIAAGNLNRNGENQQPGKGVRTGTLDWGKQGHGWGLSDAVWMEVLLPAPREEVAGLAEESEFFDILLQNPRCLQRSVVQ